MSDIMRPLDLKHIFAWIIKEFRKQNSVFGIPKQQFYYESNQDKYTIFNDRLDTPLGPAAGPHTQMTQNIISSYLVGGRFMELKTVQILDQLKIEKPCIDASDECYNTEWSQELTLEQSLDEYLKAWFLLHFIKDIFGLSNSKERGFIFNMSVGYDLQGIKSERMNAFIEQLKDSSKSVLFDKYKNILIKEVEKLDNFLLFDRLNINQLLSSIENISPNISNSVTLSTMHGCPPQEIESIAKYLIKEKGLHTYIKLNPTLLGYDIVSKMLTELGYSYIQMDKSSFEHDLQLRDAIPMCTRLKNLASDLNKEFGIKLSNTLGIKNNKNLLPDENMYMSGRSLFPLTINLAHKLATEFDGNINISFSGGANYFNVDNILETGIYPVTLVTDLLKPGGYARLKQMAVKVDSISDVPSKIDLHKLESLAKDSLTKPEYRKEKREITTIKISKSLPMFDCYVAPCVEACPIKQDVPEYIRLVKQKKYPEALNLIYDKNPLPHITGYICDHQCQFHCTRWDYDDPVLIRRIKREAAEKGFYEYLKKYKNEKDSRPRGNDNNLPQIAIIGAGPSGLSAAYFLVRAGFKVTVFEKEDRAGGVVQHVIPEFRLPQSAIDKDIEFIKQMGVKFKFGIDDNFSISELQTRGFKYIYLAIGAEKAKQFLLEKTDGQILNAVEFLRDYRKNVKFNLGKNVAIIGGGNTAMDGARAAKRCEGVENVYIIYRRTKEFMPADKEEFDEAIKDGVIYKELLLPVSFSNNQLKCQKMELEKIDSDGRRKVKPVNDQFEMFKIDTLISAIGEQVDLEILNFNNIQINNNGFVKVYPDTNETSIENVHIGGDAMRGPSTVVESIADGRKAANSIIAKENLHFRENDQKSKILISENEINDKKGTIAAQDFSNISKESERCLDCNYICNKCVDVCPNRANIPISIEDQNGEFKDKYQILHIDGLCNECGNCETFCPYQGSPYKEKFTLFWSEQDFNDSNNDGFYPRFENDSLRLIKIRNENIISKITSDKINDLPEKINELIKSIIKNYSYLTY